MHVAESKALRIRNQEVMKYQRTAFEVYVIESIKHAVWEDCAGLFRAFADGDERTKFCFLSSVNGLPFEEDTREERWTLMQC